MKLSSVSGLLLAYHEEGVINETVSRLQKELEKITSDWEIVVVGYEGCKDRTNKLVEEMHARDPRIRLVIQKTTEKGYGKAFAIGLAAAQKDWIFQSDADGQYDLTNLKDLAARAEQNIDLVHGYRAKRQDPIERKVFAFCYNTALKMLFFIRLRDVDSAFKLIRRSAISNLKLKSQSGFCVAELIVQMKRQRSRFVQMPITHLPRLHGEALSEKGIPNPLGLQLPNLNLVFGTLGEMVRYRFNSKENSRDLQ